MQNKTPKNYYKPFIVSLIIIFLAMGVTSIQAAVTTTTNEDGSTTTVETVTNETNSDDEAEVEADETASPSSETTSKLKERIERIVEEKKEQIKGIISDLDQSKKGFIGEITRVSEESITVKTSKATKIIPIEEEVTLLKDNKEISIEDIAVENWVVVMGVIEDDAFKAIRVLVTTESLRPSTHVISLGSVSDVSTKSLTLVPRSGGDNLELVLNSKTTYEDLNGEEIDQSDIEEEVQALVVAYEDEEEKIAKRVRILTVLDTATE